MPAVASQRFLDVSGIVGATAEFSDGTTAEIVGWSSSTDGDFILVVPDGGGVLTEWEAAEVTITLPDPA